MKIDSPKRTVAKTISWRVLSLIITFAVTIIITRSATFAVSISLLDTTIKFFSYYFHERYWTHVKWGRFKKKKLKKKKNKQPQEGSSINSSSEGESRQDLMK